MYRSLAMRSLWRSVASVQVRAPVLPGAWRPAVAVRTPMASRIRRFMATDAGASGERKDSMIEWDDGEEPEEPAVFARTQAAGTAEAVEAVEAVEEAENTEAPESAGPLNQIAPELEPKIKRSLPSTCSGCGAFTQTKHAQHPGYYDLNRKSVRHYLGLEERPVKKATDVKDNHQVLAVINQIGEEKLKQLGIDPKSLIQDENPDLELQKNRDGVLQPPLCDRCHVLIHHRVGEPIFHPSVHALSATLDESPWKYNHVFHVIDAADFPMSLVPRLHQIIGDIHLRTRNRRSSPMHFQGDRAITMSFVITRSDLLAPKKEQVDALMPYLREVLRESLGRVGRSVRLGNLWCVSAKRAWWTASLREEIWRRGGALWLIGKINVGKSQLFETVYPKGRLPQPEEPLRDSLEGSQESDTGFATEASAETATATSTEPSTEPSTTPATNPPAQPRVSLIEETNPLKIGEWLPPPRKEEMYPAMPTVSDLAGTTASPIRIPFGGGKGELIDLPGLARTTLTNNVMTKFRDQLIMKSRIVPEQQVVKPGQSLLIGGMFRITPRSEDTIILAYNFTPMEPHVTNTQKAIEISEQRSDLVVNNIAVPGVGSSMKLAHSVALKYDVTRERAGPLTRKNAVGLNTDRLPFRVLAIDILIESVGWVELVAQVRTRALYHGRPAADYETPRPQPLGSDGWGAKDKYTPRFSGEGPWHKDFREDYDETNPWQTMERSQAESHKKDLRKLKRANAHIWDAIESGTDVPTTGSSSTKPSPAQDAPEEDADAVDLPEPNWPVVDIFSPHGHYIGMRRPMNGWLLNKPLVTKEQKRGRPRKSMKGAKKKAKLALRMAKSTYFTG
ncbi:hypothetical protein TD95_002771 [Thielaviopsis punctulata]|uniref:G domain-containing protein n=1 Tax=Thielaviopsis punctulata TaxID=72032 RepID=A0A0F4ZAY2_9PEZI|nr:hypothetical protein TD95_002771 [Thielaviopsis punctulata]